jgi:hypothetical protein
VVRQRHRTRGCEMAIDVIAERWTAGDSKPM